MKFEFIPILIGLWTAYFLYTLFSDESDDFLRSRLKKAAGGGKKNVTYKFLLDLVKPLSSKNLTNKESKSKIHKLLQTLGVSSSDEDILEFENKRLFSLLVAVVLCSFLLIFSFNNMSVSIAILICYLVYKYPEFKIQSLIKQKQKEFLRFFPDAVDLLSVCVEAGLGIDSAIERVAQEFSGLSKAVSGEFSRLSKDVMSGLPREEALKNMTKRVNTQDLQSFSAMLIQSDKMGTSVVQSLRVYCDTLRTRKKQRIEELVQGASAKMTVPMILFLLPALFIVILYPAIIKIMENMAG